VRRLLIKLLRKGLGRNTDRFFSFHTTLFQLLSLFKAKYIHDFVNNELNIISKDAVVKYLAVETKKPYDKSREISDWITRLLSSQKPTMY
jgi:hypothetical protein